MQHGLKKEIDLITGGHITPANTADTTEFEKLVNGSPGGSIILADKGYASEKNRTVLANKKLKDGIMYKAARNKPLTTAQRIINRFISSLRYKVEQTIGTLKKRLSVLPYEIYGS